MADHGHILCHTSIHMDIVRKTALRERTRVAELLHTRLMHAGMDDDFIYHLLHDWGDDE